MITMIHDRLVLLPRQFLQDSGSRIFEKLLSSVNDTWKCSGNALLCKALMYARSFWKRTCPYLCFTWCTAPAHLLTHLMMII